MRKYILIISLCSWLCCGHFLFAQEVEWVKKVVGITTIFEVSQLAVSPNGNVAAAQMYIDTVLNIDGRDVPPITGRTSEFYCMFVDAKGAIQRIMQPGGRYSRHVRGLVADSSDNFYIAGGCEGVAVFDTIVQNNSMFFLKYDSKGKMIESLNSKLNNKQSSSHILAISVSKNASYLSGLYGGSIIINERDTLKNGGGFLMKLDNENNLQWIKSIKGKIDNQPFFNNEHSIASDETGVIFAGDMHENLTYTFDTLSYQARNGDILLQKLDNAGNIVWGGALGGADLEGVIEVKINNGIAYLCGYTDGNLEFSNLKFPNIKGIFMLALDFSTGKPLWVKKASVNSFAFTKTGQIVTVGSFHDTLKVGNKTYIPKTLTDTSRKKYSSDLYFSIMDSKTGEVIYDWQMGGHGSEIGPVIATDTLNNIYVLSHANYGVELGDSVFDIGYYGSFLAKISLPVLGVQENSKSLQASVYPNPAALGKVSINFNLKKYGAINLGVTDINGKKMQEDILKFFAQGENNFTINANNYPNGKYFCSLQHDGITETISFVIQK